MWLCYTILSFNFRLLFLTFIRRWFRQIKDFDLGYFTKEKMIPEFADAAAKLKVGQISNPVKTSVGWHIIKVEDKRKTKPLTYEEAKPILLDKIRRDAYRKELTTIRDSAKIEILDLPKPAADKSKKK